jgi:hypothetical protein
MEFVTRDWPLDDLDAQGTLQGVTFQDFADYRDEGEGRYWELRSQGNTCLLCGRRITNLARMCRSHRGCWRNMSPRQRARALATRVLELCEEGAPRDTVVWRRGL